MLKNDTFLFGKSFLFVLEILTFLYYANKRKYDIIRCTKKEKIIALF